MLLSKVPGYFKTRRDALMRAHPESVFIFPSNREVLRNPDVHYPFRQESNFYYLSGFEEPESVLVLASTGGKNRTILFVRKRDPEKELWEGERYGTDGALSVFGADEAYLIDEFDKKLGELLKGCARLYLRLGQDELFDRRMMSLLEAYRRTQDRNAKGMETISDPSEILGEMRLFKGPEEIGILRKACQITAEGHKTLMKEVRQGMNEFEVEALIDYSFRKGGCRRMGYGSIVAGGKNATCLHYVANNEVLRDGELLLIDAGGEYEYYTSDITRTFPVSRRYTDAQAKIYDLVLKSQVSAISMVKPGAKLGEIHQHVCEVLVVGLLSLGLLKGEQAEILKSGGLRRFYPHRTSHWLGMDVHDVGLHSKNGEPRKLEPGMVFTIEPGLYVQPGDRDAPAAYRNIGVRIEDDILVTTDGCEVLTRDAPKARGEIEALRA
jgi:Xaa-Pro aminopeptidase